MYTFAQPHPLLVPTMLAAAASAQRTRQAFPGAELQHVYGTTETTAITTLLPQILKRDLREPHWAGRQTQVSGG